MNIRGPRSRGSPPNPARGEHALELGKQIRGLRKESGWTLEDLARSIGLSKSAISQIESGKIEPSLHTLRRLAEALKIPLAKLFETRPFDNQPVVRKGERKVFHLSRNRLRYELLSPDLVNKRVEFLRVELDPDPSDGPQPYAHEGEEYGIVIQGKVEIRINATTYILKAGDSIFFHATLPHYVRNAGRTKAVMVWAISPPTY